jgi:hypothetical protein
LRGVTESGGGVERIFHDSPMDCYSIGPSTNENPSFHPSYRIKLFKYILLKKTFLHHSIY